MTLLTDKEAATKWCPMVRHEGDDGGTFNCGGQTSLYGRDCIGSRCAMWRLAGLPEYRSLPCDDRSALVEPERPPHIPRSWVFSSCGEDDAACWYEPEEIRLARQRGYCGLAGTPALIKGA